MAVQVRSRRVVNAGTRSVRRSKRAMTKAGFSRSAVSSFGRQFKRFTKAKKRKNPAKRKLSPKQIAIFGTPRQKAALRAKRSRVRNAGKKSIRRSSSLFRQPLRASAKVFKRTKQERAKVKAQKRRKNVGEIVSISLAGLAGNPGRKRKSMAKRKRRNYGTVVGRSFSHTKVSKRRRKNPARRKTHRSRSTAMVTRRRRRANPVYRVRRMHRRRSNPGMGSLTSGILGKVIGIGTGLLLPRYLTQLVLGGNNSGWMGYGGNIVASVGLGYAAGKLTKSKDFGMTVMVGGIVSTVFRYISENTQYGSFIQSSLAGAGKGGDIALGMIQDSSFPTPQTFAPGSMTKAVVPSATRGYVTAQVAQQAQMAAAGSTGKPAMGSFRGRATRRVI